MKITSFAVIALLLTVTSNSQTIKQKSIYAKQMTYEIGGDLFFSSTQYTYNDGTFSHDYTVRNYAINVSVGFFVIDGLKLAVEPTFDVTSYDNNSWSGFKLYLTPEYVFNMNNEVYPFLGGSVGYTSMSPVNGPTESGFSWGVKGGVKINPLGNVLIDFGLSYYQETYNYSGGFSGEVKQHNNVLGFKGGISLFFR